MINSSDPKFIKCTYYFYTGIVFDEGQACIGEYGRGYGRRCRSILPSGMMSSSLMGRCVRTVGAGLAYGGANCHTVERGNGGGARLSRFNLGSMGKEGSRLGIALGHDRQGSGGGGKNEEWD